jgi:hypothetical protein
MMVLTLLFALTQDPDKVIVSAEFQDATVLEIAKSLTEITGVAIDVDDAARKKIDGKAKITFKVKDLTLTTVVKLLVSDRGLQMKVVDQKKIVITARGD